MSHEQNGYSFMATKQSQVLIQYSDMFDQYLQHIPNINIWKAPLLYDFNKLISCFIVQNHLSIKVLLFAVQKKKRNAQQY